MSKIKDKPKNVKDKVSGAREDATDTISGHNDDNSTSSSVETRTYEEGAAGTELGRRDDSLTEYRKKEPMTPAKIKEHEPTAVSRDMTDGAAGPVIPPWEGSQGEARERARRSGMTKGTAGAAETGSEYEQGAAGTNE